MGNAPIRGGILVLFLPVFPSNVELCRKMPNFCLPFFGKNILRILSDYGTFYLTVSVCVTVRMQALQRREFTFMEATVSLLVADANEEYRHQFIEMLQAGTGPTGGGRDRGRTGPAGPTEDTAP